jgi:hypothetical protein
MARKKLKVYIICFACILQLQFSYAQSIIEKGLLLDKLTNQPIVGASVFINSSAIGAVSGSDGTFNLLKFIQAQIEKPILTIVAIGYETEKYNLVNSTGRVVIYLKPKVRELETVTVRAAEKNGWEKYGKDFIESFLSYSDFSKLCKIENPEVLKFYYDPNNNALNVVARKPLIIQNKALGYKITYWLESYSQNFNSRILTYSGLTLFEDLIRPNKRKGQAEKWLLNRAIAYQGSVMHFVRSVHAGTLASSGFVVRRLDKVEGSRKGRYSNVVDPKILLEADFLDTIEDQKMLKFPKFLYVLYDKELEELPYLIKMQPFKKPTPAPQPSFLSQAANAVAAPVTAATDYLSDVFWNPKKLFGRTTD